MRKAEPMTPRKNQARSRHLSKLKVDVRETYKSIKRTFSRQHDDQADSVPPPSNQDKAEPILSPYNQDQIGPTIPSNNEDEVGPASSQRNNERYPYLSKLRMSVKSKYEKVVPNFLPCDKLHDLVTEDTVQLAFEDVGVENRELVRWVLKSGRRLFLILVLSSGKSREQLSHLEDLKNDGIDDTILPLSMTLGSENLVWSQASRKDGGSTKRFVSLESWEDNDLHVFKSHQWPLSAPVFGVEFRHQLDWEQPLPYLSINPEPVSSGIFGEVLRAEIHPAHIDAQRLEELGVKLKYGSEGILIAIKEAKNNEDFGNFFDQQTSNPAMSFDKEETNLRAFQYLTAPHLIQPIAAYQWGSHRCLIFLWAEGGNLSEYWQRHESDREDKDSLKWLIGEFVGLSSALELLRGENGRHGDLKPENILWFMDDQKRGTLKIANMGLAAFQEKEANTGNINDNGTATENPSGTFRYKPPEMDKARDRKTSRLQQYDMWSMGCIIIELLVWLMHGYNGVRTFREGTQDYIWVKKSNPSTGTTSYHVDDYVLACLGAMEDQLNDNSAYMELLRLARNRLLVVNVSKELDSSPSYREIAKELHSRMQRIQQSCEANDDYLAPIAISPDSEEQPKRLDDTWSSVQDDKFAAQFFKLIDWNQIKPEHVALCSQCEAIYSDQLFLSQGGLSEPELLSRTCLPCRLLLDSLYKHDKIPSQVVSSRHNEAIRRLKGGPDLLSIYVDPKIGLDIPKGFQLGLPRLPNQGGLEQFTLLREWIKACDEKHENCRGENDNAPIMPTRLIDLGNPLRIVESDSIEPSNYIALSHCWGNLGVDERRVCAQTDNIDTFMKSINFDDLPRTFRDAITVARGIGVNYLWIDSLCIIQNDEDDQKHEITTMEQVFSSAYCTIAASSSRSSFEGFLNCRRSRPCVKIRTSGGTILYVCPNIDDFHRDVDLGALNSRGWVLQERALSRRTIFYTSTQVYYECGAGVQCETLACLQNSKAAILGDARFPFAALGYYSDGRQMFVQELYERYSGLAFSKEWDRPMAILGLERRLARAFKTQAAHGFFAPYFAKLLLWKRRDSRWMTRFTQRPGSSRVPTWSWLSKTGAIKYLDLKFQETHWEVDDFINPFERFISTWGTTRTEEKFDVFYGLARRLTMSKLDMLVSVIFDEGDNFEVDDLRCVFIGRDKIENGLRSIKHHVLVIHQINDGSGKAVYERVGVASLKPEHVAGEGSWVEIR